MSYRLMVVLCGLFSLLSACATPEETTTDEMAVTDEVAADDDEGITDESEISDEKDEDLGGEDLVPDSVDDDQTDLPDLSDDAVDEAVDEDAVQPDDVIPAGELIIEQIYLPGMNMGEAAIVVGPDGTTVLIDVANDGHGAQILEAVTRRKGEAAIDWAIITHYHNDHIGGFDNLFGAGANQHLEVRKGIVLRGFYDIGADMPGVEDFNEFCTLSQGELAAQIVTLCAGAAEMPCGNASSRYPTSDCPGLLMGDLSTADDDAAGSLSFIPLGNGAKLYFTHASGWVAQSGGAISAENNGITIGYGETDQENARSLGGVIKWGDFNYLFAGDTQGRDIKIEGFIASHSAGLTITPGGVELLPSGTADVIHLSHHGLASSTAQEWVDWLFPDNGQGRNAVVGTTGIYVTSPAQPVLDRVVPRLGTGFVFATANAYTHGTSPQLIIANAAVTAQVSQGGAQYVMVTGVGTGAITSGIYTTVP